MAQQSQAPVPVDFTPGAMGYLQEVISRGICMLSIPNAERDGEPNDVCFEHYRTSIFAGVTAFRINNHGSRPHMGDTLWFAHAETQEYEIDRTACLQDADNVITTNRIKHADPSPHIRHWLWSVAGGLMSVEKHINSQDFVIERKGIAEQYENECNIKNLP